MSINWTAVDKFLQAHFSKDSISGINSLIGNEKVNKFNRI